DSSTLRSVEEGLGASVSSAVSSASVSVVSAGSAAAAFFAVRRAEVLRLEGEVFLAAVFFAAALGLVFAAPPLSVTGVPPSTASSVVEAAALVLFFAAAAVSAVLEEVTEFLLPAAARCGRSAALGRSVFSAR